MLFLIWIAIFLVENEENQEKRKLIQNFQNILQKFTHFKVDLMEFYLLKSIVLFKSGKYILFRLDINNIIYLIF